MTNGKAQLPHLLRRNRQRIRKIPLKSTISEGFWSEWGDSNARSLEPKSSAIPTSLHPDIHFPAMIPRRGVKIKFFLSVVIYVVKAAFVPLSAIGENPANAGVARLCGVSQCPVPDTATALPKIAPVPWLSASRRERIGPCTYKALSLYGITRTDASVICAAGDASAFAAPASPRARAVAPRADAESSSPRFPP